MSKIFKKTATKLSVFWLVGFGLSQTLYGLTINTAMGEINIIRVKKPKVITLEHRYTEMVLSLGIIPVGGADIKSYQTFDSVESNKLLNTKELGRRAAPSIERIASLKPNLIIGAKMRNANAYDILSGIAPTLLFSYIEPSAQGYSALDQMLFEFDELAKSLNRTAEAQVVLDYYKHVIKQAKADINRLKVQGKLRNSTIAIAQFLPGSPSVKAKRHKTV